MADISVIVPVYNVEQYLEECLDSLIAQTHKDMEFICINDGSTDNSLRILQKYAAWDARIKVVDKPNEGYGKTMNRGLAMASSPWIGIVESDDFVKTDMFERLYEAAKDSEADLVKCNFYKYKAKEGKNITCSKEYPEELFGKEFNPLKKPEVYGAHNSIWAGLYRKTFLDTNKIVFHETPGAAYQDISFQFKVLSLAKKMKLIEEALIYYRTDNLHSSVYNPDKIFCIADEMREIEDFIKKRPGEHQKILWPILARKKYYDYRWNYLRLTPEFQFAFLKLMSEEFKADDRDGKFEKVCWINKEDEQDFYEIINSPISYFTRTKKKKHRDERIQAVGTANRRVFLKGILREIEESEITVIYGAGVRGKWVAERLIEKGVPASKLLFAVSRKDTKDKVLDIAVEEIDRLADRRKDLFVIIAVKGEAQIEMLGELQRLRIEEALVADEEFMEAMQS